MIDIRLSDNFTLAEFAFTTHTDLLELNQVYTSELVRPLTALCATILQPVREHYQLPVKVTSGVRCGLLNERVGGVSSSQHLQGQAADIIIPGIELVNIWDWIKLSGLPFGQNILEKSWIHLSLGEPWRSKEKCGKSFILT